jgi:hypothetical protein
MESDLSSSVVQFYKSNVRDDLALLHYVTFIEPLVVVPSEALSFTSVSFHNNSNKEVLQTKLHDPFLLLEDHYFAITLLHQNTYVIRFEDLLQEMLNFFSLSFVEY